MRDYGLRITDYGLRILRIFVHEGHECFLKKNDMNNLQEDYGLRITDYGALSFRRRSIMCGLETGDSTYAKGFADAVGAGYWVLGAGCWEESVSSSMFQMLRVQSEQ
jgi:hypothetical protein